LPDGLAEVQERVAEAGHLSIFLDFDGTVTPIVEHPADAYLDSKMKAVLEKLARRENTLLAFVSGRSVDDLCRRAAIANAVHAGNHGLEIRGPVHFVEPAALAKRDLLKRLRQELAAALSHISGAWVEDKSLTASVHFRQARAHEEEGIAHIVRSALTPYSAIFQLNPGKKVFEIVPRTKWHKGAAVCWINARLAPPGTASIYIGDDRTDEDAFTQLPGEITICVGRWADTAARFYLQDCAEVRTFLEWLSTLQRFNFQLAAGAPRQ